MTTEQTSANNAARRGGSGVERVVGRPVPERAKVRWADLSRSAKPVRCEICEWRGRRLVARSRPCPACGSRVEFA